ncbi:MAG: hypothetical protein AB7O98_00270 [Hyphomonadaceae bacterium]
MTDFDALLKREFAEAHEPADDGFSVRVGHVVARRETAAKTRAIAQQVGMAAAGAAICYGLYSFAGTFGQEMMATAGLEVARAHGALSTAPSMSGAAQGLMQSVGAGMTQILLITAALAGGAVAYRATQD